MMSLAVMTTLWFPGDSPDWTLMIIGHSPIATTMVEKKTQINKMFWGLSRFFWYYHSSLRLLSLTFMLGTSIKWAKCSRKRSADSAVNWYLSGTAACLTLEEKGIHYRVKDKHHWKWIHGTCTSPVLYRYRLMGIVCNNGNVICQDSITYYICYINYYRTGS